MRPAVSIALCAALITLLVRAASAAPPFREGFESWTHTAFGETWTDVPGTGGPWSLLGCRVATNGGRTGWNALEIKGGQINGAEPIAISAAKTGDVGEVSFWYRTDQPKHSVYLVAYRTEKDGPIQHFPNWAGMLAASSTNWFKWRCNLAGPEWRTNRIYLYIARNSPDATALLIDDLEIGPHGAYRPPDRASIAERVPAGLPRPPAPWITTNVAPPLPTGDWWTSIAAVRGSGLLSAKPLLFYTKPASLELAYPRRFVDQGFVPAGAIRAPFDVNGGADISVTATGGSFPAQSNGAARVDGWGDFSVRARVGNDRSYLTTHLIHGSPFAFAEFTACEPRVNLPHGYTVEYKESAISALVIAVPRDGVTNHYALFAPARTTWDTESGSITPRLPPGPKYLTVAVLPSRGWTFDQKEFDLLRVHAFTLVTNTMVGFSYQPSNALVTLRYRVQTRALQGANTNTLLGLLPLHHKNSRATLSPTAPYETLLGPLHLHAGREFAMQLRFRGIVPQFPAPANTNWSLAHFTELARAVDPVAGGGDLYAAGKAVQRLARLVPALHSTGLNDVRDRVLTGLRNTLTDFYTYEDGDAARFFAYEPRWGTLLGYPEAFGSAWALNDHHFQHGLFVYASAILGLYDPDFVARYGTAVDLVARDYANPDRVPAGRYPLPWLRHFDPWEGHSWASGLGGGKAFCPDCGDQGPDPNAFSLASFAGPDQESTSECMNSWAALYLWGEVRGNAAFRDMGIIGYTLEAEAIREYVYDADNRNWPVDFVPTMISRLFGDALDTATHFSAEPQHAWGIQYLPTGPHLTYQGYFPEYRARDYDYFRGLTSAPVSDGWRDIHMMYRSFFEPERVLADYTPGQPVDFGNTEANLYYWINALASLGRVDTRYYSDAPSAVVLTREGVPRGLAYNFTAAPKTIRFFRESDGAPVGTAHLPRQGLAVIPLDAK